MSPKKRWSLWLILLAATLVAVVFPVSQDKPSLAPMTKLSRQHVIISPPILREVANTQMRVVNKDEQNSVLPELKNDPFAAVSWNATPPEPPKPPPVVQEPGVMAPVVPVEPPLPYQFLGRMLEPDGAIQIFLSRGQDSIIAHVGDVLDTNYKLVSIDEHKLTIAYLPMGHLHDISLDAH